MKRLLCLTVTALTAALGFAAPKPETPKADKDYQDVVHFADKRPVLLRLHVTVDGRPLTAVWNDYVSKVFQHLDTDRSGFLDNAKVQRMPSANELFGGDYDNSAPTLAQLDSNGDGKVSREELAGYFRHLGAMPFQVPGVAGRRGQVENELQNLIFLSAGGERSPDTDAVNAALFKLLDSNGDGKLSKEELAAAPAVLLKRDRNDDEVITPNEIVPGSRAEANDGNLQFTIIRGGGRRNQDNGAFWQMQGSSGKAELARRLQRYAKKEGQKPAAKLSRTDLGLDEATFARLDVDGDGKLDTEELSRFADRTPDLELKVDLGRKATVQVVKRGLLLESQIRPGKDGVLTLEMTGARIDLKALTAGTNAAQPAQQERDQYVQAFKRADRDNNGYLDMNEAMRSRLYRNLFKAMDRDGDGMLYQKEVLAYLDAFQGLRATASVSCATVGITSEGKGLLELLDTDGDGRLSVRELRNAGKLLAELDRDKDGMLSRTEIPRCSQAAFRLGSPTTGPRGAAFDGNNVIVFADGNPFGPRQQRPMRPARGPEWFRKMDRNGDGDVSRREFLGTDAQFKAIDTDGDGLISVEEAEAFDKMKKNDPK